MAQALPGVLLRTYKEGTYLGDSIRGTGVKTEEEHFKESLRVTGTEDLVNVALKSVKERSAESGAKGLEDLHREVDKQLREAVESQPNEAIRKETEAVRTELRTKLNQEFGSVQEDAAVGDLEKLTLKSKATDVVQDTIRKLGQEANMSTHDTNMLSQSAVEALEREIESMPVERGGDVERMFTPDVVSTISERAVASQVNASRELGRREKARFEAEQLPKMKRALAKNVSTSKVSDNNAKWYYRKIGTTSRSNLQWGVGGRIDGFADGKLVEIKNRVRRIPDRLPEYDMVQIQTYMHILKLPECVVLQRLKHLQKESSQMSIRSWSQREWDVRVADRLQMFVDFIDELTIPAEALCNGAHVDEVSKQEVLNALGSTNRVQAREKDPEYERVVRSAFLGFLESRDASGVIAQ